ncbi:MAG TPA: hypothetical protein VKZ53_18095 [Candidatus Angelobacter sp.]|nr:hypothetical protein [Candidatus Angelobacter sp.]
MDTTKLFIFGAVFLVFLWLTRRLFPNEKPPMGGELPQQPPPSFAKDAFAKDGFEDDAFEDFDAIKQPAVIGAELPFPIDLPPRVQRSNGTYNRPHIVNYYFSKTDLVRGPEDPRVLCDTFFVEFANPESRARWTGEYVVVTPAGLQAELDSLVRSGIFFSGLMVIVPNWNLGTILKTILDTMMEEDAGAPDGATFLPDSSENMI